MSTEHRVTHLAAVGLHAGYAPGDFKSKNIHFEVAAGELLAIMGPSGSGKSTLLQGLQGMAPHSKGEVWVNGHNLGTEGLRRLRSHVGEVPQDDIVVNELTARENIRTFNRIAVDSERSRAEIEAEIERILAELGILHIADKVIGPPDARRPEVSGGQRKRINIAMELINDPDILIIDEPTSGLSSHDSLKLIESLKAIARDRGRIVIIIIHQPNSEIFSLIDRLVVLDGAGHCVRSGLRHEVVAWFGTQTDKPFEHRCATPARSIFATQETAAAGPAFYFPDRILETVELRKENAEAQLAAQGAKSPEARAQFLRSHGFWARESEAFAASFRTTFRPPQATPYPTDPAWRPLEALKDFLSLTARQTLIKWRDGMCRVLTFLAPLLLGLMMAAVFHSTPDGQSYRYADNAMFPQLLFMLIICTMFLGLVGSVFEIIKDRKMLDRESKRRLWTISYLGAEVVSLALIVAIQTTLMLAAGLWATDAPSALFAALWPFIFLAGMVAVSIGLLVSTLIPSPIPAYNMIPLILIPQIILGGALLPFAHMGKAVYLWEERVPSRAPILAKALPATWAYEAAVAEAWHVTRDQSLPMNVALQPLQHLVRGDFLSLHGTTVLHGDSARQDDPATVNPVALGLFMAAFLLSTWVWLKRDYDYRPGATRRWLWWQAVVIAAAAGGSLALLDSRAAEVPAPPAPSAPHPASHPAPHPAAPSPTKSGSAAAAPAAAAASTGPSFDCTKAASTVERSICGSPELAALDREMARSYRRVIDRAKVLRLPDRDVERYRAAHRTALLERNRARKPEEIRAFYLRHNEQLRTWLCVDLHGC